MKPSIHSVTTIERCPSERQPPTTLLPRKFRVKSIYFASKQLRGGDYGQQIRTHKPPGKRISESIVRKHVHLPAETRRATQQSDLVRDARVRRPRRWVWSMDKALSLVKQAMKAWHGLLACPCCPYDDDLEVMLLTFMSMRAVTRYLQRLSPRYTNTSLQGPGSNSPQSAKDDERLLIGSFELEGNDRMLVLRVLYQITLQKVKCILHSLQVIQNKKKRLLLEKTQNKLAGVDDYQASSNLFHIQQISYGLVASLQTLESSLNVSKDSGAVDPLGTL